MVFIDTLSGMATRRKRPGRPPKGSGNLKSESLLVRLEPAEKEAFEEAANLSGLAVSSWVRERLRRVAVQELQAAGRQIAFLS
jgi:uncharacterized protein (DUF1778 family)